MAERLGNVLYWLGCIVAACVVVAGIIMFYVMLTGGNQTDANSAPYVGGAIMACSLIPWMIGRAFQYILSGR